MNVALALKIRGWMTLPELLVLAEFASTRKQIVEVGSYCGRSARVMADNTDGNILCVDPWNGICLTFGLTVHSNGYNKEFREFTRNMADHILAGKADFRIIDFRELWLEFTPDMIFLDAIHTYEELVLDIKHSLQLMPKGLLCGHDYCAAWPGVMQAVDEIFPQRQVKESIWYVEL